MKSERLAIVDGFRAIAIIAVVLFHVYPGTVAGGFIGVDIFFVISGFVIALRYLDQLIEGTATFASFYARRIRRLLPACLVVLVVTTAFSTAIMVPKDLANYGFTLLPQAVFLQNVAFWQLGDYFTFEPLVKPLLHTWSLAVEEQFYLLFPVLIIALRWFPKWAIGMMLAVLVASLILGFVGMRLSVPMTFYLLPFRAWEFMIGILASVLYKKWRDKKASPPTQIAASIAVLLGTGAVLVAIFAFRETAAFPGPQSLLALSGTALVMVAQGHVRPWVDRAFAVPPIQHFGRISYSWYLWHWPVVSFHFLLNWRAMTGAESVLVLLVGYGLGAISYYTVERLGQHSVWLQKPRNTIGLLVVFAVFCAAVGLAATLSNGLLGRYQGREKALYAAQMSIPPYRCPITNRLRFGGPPFCQINAVDGGKGVLLIGDSHADLMKPVLAELATDSGRPFYFLVQNCRISDFGNRRNCSSDDWSSLMRQIKSTRITDVIVISRFTRKFDAARFTQSIDDLASQDVRVTVSLPTPENKMLDPAFWIRAGKAGSWPEWLPLSRDEVSAANADLSSVMRMAAARHPNVTLIDSTPLLCPDRCRLSSGTNVLFQDDHHLTSFGAKFVSSPYRDIIASR